ncbi:MAG: bi-domain-containing oxidoreductase, partial [Candidatus Sulfotelmatobacter sp.]
REVISKVRRDGIYSAIQTVSSRLDQPQNPGYSSAGTVIAIGEGVTDLRPGDRVACAGTGFAVHAEVACVPRLLVAKIPARDPNAGEEVSFEDAAFGTLGAVALHGIRNAEAGLGDLVAVIGLGLLGQLAVQLLKGAGCRVLGMDIDAPRSQLAQSLGADAVASSAADFRDLCAQLSGGMGVDSVLITAETLSSDPVNLAGSVARDRAIVVAVGTVGMEIERKTYYEKELDFRISRSYGPGRYDSAYEQKGRDYPIGYARWTETRNLQAFLQLLAERKIVVGPLITHTFAVEDAPAAYELITGKSHEPFLGVVIRYSENVDPFQTLAIVPREHFAPSPSKSDSKISVTVGVLGAGVFASGTLIPVLKASSDTSLVAICAATGSHAQHAGQKYGFQNCTTDEAQLLHDASINTVVIATRHHLHAKQVLNALAAGKHIFCEKPLCLTEAELRAIVRACAGILPHRRPALMVGYNRRFAPMIVELKQFFAPVSEPLALHYRINAGSLPADHWVNDREQGGGRILGEVCHFVDLLMFLAGSPIVEIEARSIGNASRYSGDNVLASLAFANGSQGTISYLANGDRAFSKERIEVFGGGRAAVFEDFRRLELVRNGRKQTTHSRWRQDKGHNAEWAAFVQCVLGKRDAPISFDELISSSLATLRMNDAVASGQRLKVDSAEFIETARNATNLRVE